MFCFKTINKTSNENKNKRTNTMVLAFMGLGEHAHAPAGPRMDHRDDMKRPSRKIGRMTNLFCEDKFFNFDFKPGFIEFFDCVWQSVPQIGARH